jgi:hypothetical protein
MDRAMGSSNPQPVRLPAVGARSTAATSSPVMARTTPLDTLVQAGVLHPAGKDPGRSGYLVVLPAHLHWLPHGALADGTRVLPRRVPESRAALYGHVFRRLYVEEQTITQPELAGALTKEDGLSSHDIGRGLGNSEGSPPGRRGPAA